MKPASTQMRVLYVCDPTLGGPPPIFPEDSDVTVVQSVDDAFHALHREGFDCVVCTEAQFLVLERAADDQQAAVILDAIGQGVCIVDTNGALVYANPKMRSFPKGLQSRVAEVCLKAFSHANDHDKNAPAHNRARRFSLTAGEDQYFDVTITPVYDRDNVVVQMAAIVWEVTHSRRLQKKIDAIDLAGRELVRLDATAIASMDMEERIEFLESKMIRYMHDLLNYDNFAVLLVDKKSNRLEFILEKGMCKKSHEQDIYVSTENNGISGYVAATGRSYICHDTSKDPRYLQGLESARSSLTVPLRLQDQVIGVFNIESDTPAAFNEDDRQFAEILARYVGMALNFLDLLVVERNRSTGRMAEDVSGEIAGPLNDIITEATTLMEEYIGHDDLRHHLSAICDSVAEVKQTLKEVATPRGGILGRGGEPAAADPILCGRQVLVADDEEIIRETVAGVLRRHGCEVETAADGIEAVAMLRRRPYEIVIADIKMPNKSGYEVFAAARSARPDIAVILMTGFGYDPNHSVVRARREGLSAVLFKPFKVEQLLEAIRDAVRAAR